MQSIWQYYICGERKEVVALKSGLVDLPKANEGENRADVRFRVAGTRHRICDKANVSIRGNHFARS